MLLFALLLCFSFLAIVKQECLNNRKMIQRFFLDSQALLSESKSLNHVINLREAPNKAHIVTCPTMHETHSSPFIAIILKGTSGQFLCMGSILDAESILSAKNCFGGKSEDSSNDYYILAGYFKAYWGYNSQVKKVDKIIKNKELVVLKLKHPLEFNKTVKKIKLPMVNNTAILPSRDVGCQIGVFGFSVNKWDTPGNALSKSSTYSLKGVEVVPSAECDEFYKDKSLLGIKNVSDNISCLKGKTNFCWGTMGSPVVASHANGILQFGVIVLANCNEVKDYPMLNVRLVDYLNWIKSNSKQDN